jgi:tRNA(fMet)-specific endonuclease VapC
MRYLLDTNICIALLRDNSPLVAQRFQQAIARRGSVCISSLVLCELYFGAFKSSRPDENVEGLIRFLNGPVEVLSFDAEDAHAAGEIRADLQRAGKTIGSYDTLIAGQCLSKGLTVVTSNLSEFERVKGLPCQDWAK